jgi:hypothetical protein
MVNHTSLENTSDKTLYLYILTQCNNAVFEFLLETLATLLSEINLFYPFQLNISLLWLKNNVTQIVAVTERSNYN